MGANWATRTGRWRRAVREKSALPLEERLYRVIRADIETGTLPAGALLPSSERVAQELAIEEITVQSAFARLLEEGLLAVGEGGILSIASRGRAEERRRGHSDALRDVAAEGTAGSAGAGAYEHRGDRDVQGGAQAARGDRAGEERKERRRG